MHTLAPFDEPLGFDGESVSDPDLPTVRGKISFTLSEDVG